jgi:hypothetical protein
VAVPVIGVFTKYDKLITRLERTMDATRREGLSAEDLSRLAEGDAKNVLKKICFDPFEESVDKDVVPHIHVSSLSSLFCSLCPTSNSPAASPGHEATLHNLIQLTYDNVYKYLKTPSIVSAIAQKVNPGVNIDASIA